MKYVWIILALVAFGVLVESATTNTIITAPTCGCDEQLNTIQAQNSLTESNIKSTMAMYMNQTSNKFDAQQVNMESKLEIMEQRMVKHIDDKIIQETDPLKFEMMGIFIGIGLSGAIMALYISIGG